MFYHMWTHPGGVWDLDSIQHTWKVENRAPRMPGLVEIPNRCLCDLATFYFLATYSTIPPRHGWLWETTVTMIAVSMLYTLSFSLGNPPNIH